MNDAGTATAEAGRHELIQQAWGLLERRRFDHARRVIGEGLRRFPNDDEVLLLAANLDWIEDRLDAARDTLQQLLRSDPEHYGARALLAKVLRERKDFAAAERLWVELLQDEPEHADWYAEYAQVMLDTLHVEKARALAAEGLRHDPENPGCLFVHALTDVIASPSGRSESLVTLVREHPDHTRAAVALVVSLSQQRRNREALRIAQELLRADPARQDLVELVRELKASTHWSMLPLYPMQRWGWGGAVAVWVGGAFLLLPLARQFLSPGAAGVVVGLWLGYVVYSWVWPSAIRRLV